MRRYYSQPGDTGTGGFRALVPWCVYAGIFDLTSKLNEYFVFTRFSAVIFWLRLRNIHFWSTYITKRTVIHCNRFSISQNLLTNLLADMGRYYLKLLRFGQFCCWYFVMIKILIQFNKKELKTRFPYTLKLQLVSLLTQPTSFLIVICMKYVILSLILAQNVWNGRVYYLI